VSSVDDRIVNMQFNNKQFESGATQSRKTLMGLEGAIAKTGQSKGISNLGAAATGVGKKFSVMQVAGVTAVATIANKAVNAGLSLVKSLTIDPILQGWDEYNTNLKSIQTVMANTGKGIKPVQGALKQLNNFSDQTIYNFSEMAKNVGTFTAAGVGLKQSVSAIKGIANMAALSGSSSQQASGAMYQLSQAIAAGRVNLQDWNSVVNAGMGGKNLQKALIQTGTAMGTIDAKTVKWGKNIKIAGQSFRESISAKGGAAPWLTSDVLTKTLALMDGRLSKTAITANIMAKGQHTMAEATKMADEQIKAQQKTLAKQGYNREQIKSLTSMADRAYQSATVVKTLPQLMGVVKESIGSVWANAFSAIVGNFNQSKKMWTAAANSISNVIKGFSMRLNNAIVMWKRGIDGIGGRFAVIEGFKAVFKTIGSILGVVGKAFRDAFPPGGESTLAKISIGFMHLAQALVPSEATLKSLRSIFGGIFAVLHIGVSLVTGIAAGFKALFGAMFEGSGQAGGGVLALLGSVGELLLKINEMLTGGGKMKDFFVTLGTAIGTSLHPVVAIVSSVVGAIGALGGVGGGPTAFFESIQSSLGGLAGVGDKVTAVFTSISASFKSLDPSKVQAAFGTIGNMVGQFAGEGAKIATGLITGLVQGLAGAAPAIFAAIGSLGSSIIEGIKSALGVHSPSYKMIPVGAGLIAGLIIGISGGIGEALSAMGTIAKKMFQGFINMFKQLFSGMNSLDIASMFNALLTGGLLLSMKKVSDTVLDFKKIINDVVGGLTNSLKAMQQGVKAYAIKQIAIGVALLAASVIALSFIDPKKIAISIGAIGAMVGILVGAIAALGKLAKGEVNLALIGASMTMIAAAVLTLAGAIAILGNLDMMTLVKGIGSLAFIMGILTASLALLSKAGKTSLGVGPAVLAMAVAINIMAVAVAALGMMDMSTLAKGLGAMAIGLGLMVGALMILSSGTLMKQLVASGTALVLVATSLTILAGVIALFGNMDMGTLVKGFAAMAIGLTLMTASLMLLGNTGPFVILAAAGMVMMAKAMLLMVPVIGILGSMDWGTLAKGLGAVAIVMAIFVAGVAALGAVAMVVGPGLIMLGTALLLAGAGMLAFGTGFALMAAAGTAGVAVLTAAFVAFMGLLPALAQQLASAIVATLETFAKAAPRWRAAMSTIIKNMIGVLRDNIPQFGKLLKTMIATGLSVLKSAVPRFIETGFTIIDKFLASVAAHVPNIVKSAVKIAVSFMQTIGNQAGKLADAGAKMIIKFITATAKAIDNNSKQLGTAAGKLGVAIVKGIVKGIGGIAHEVMDAAGELAQKAINKIKDKLSIFSPSKVTEELGMYFGMGFAQGIAGHQKPVSDASGSLADASINAIESALLIQSPSKKAQWWGEMIGAGLAAGLKKANMPAVKSMLDFINSITAAGDSTVLSRSRAAEKAEATAAKSAVRADIAKKRAAAVPAKNKKAKKAANAAATKAANQAKKDAAAAATANKSVENAIAMRDADAKGRGDIYQSYATSNADKATKLLAKAAQESASAKALARTNARLAAQLRAQAVKDAKAAKTAADNAKKYQQTALNYYAVEVNDRIKAMRDAQDAEAKAKADQAELDAATDPQAKADILNKRAAANDVLAAQYKADMETLIAQAQAEAGKNATKALALLDQADAAAAAAKDAADQAEQQRKDAEAALGTDTTSSGSGPGTITPSDDVLAQAAKIVDNYTASMQQAEQAALADQPIQQFVQNNYSPEALSVSEVYRQTNNLMSLAQLKMGGIKRPGDS